MAILQAERGDTELIALDGQRLQTQHLAQLLQAIATAGPKSVLTALSLEDNLLTDESCGVLRTTLQDASVCPGLLNINLAGNVGITPLGQDQIRQGLPERPELKVRASCSNVFWNRTAACCFATGASAQSGARRGADHDGGRAAGQLGRRGPRDLQGGRHPDGGGAAARDAGGAVGGAAARARGRRRHQPHRADHARDLRRRGARAVEGGARARPLVRCREATREPGASVGHRLYMLGKHARGCEGCLRACRRR